MCGICGAVQLRETSRPPLDPDAHDLPGSELREALEDFWRDHPDNPRLPDDQLLDVLATLGVHGKRTNSGRKWSGVRIPGAMS